MDACIVLWGASVGLRSDLDLLSAIPDRTKYVNCMRQIADKAHHQVCQKPMLRNAITNQDAAHATVYGAAAGFALAKQNTA